MSKVIMFILGIGNRSRRKNDPTDIRQRRIAVTCWDNTVREFNVNIIPFREDGEYGKWLALCKSRRELFELKRRNGYL